MVSRGAGGAGMDMAGDQMGGDPVLRHRARTLWVPATLALLGVWLLFAPATFGYGDPAQVTAEVAEVTADRGLADVAIRGAWMTWSDVASGILLVVFALLWLAPRRFWAGWAASLVGLWLMFAPLLFWAPDESAYLNGLIVGGLVVALTVLIPGMPGMVAIMQPGPEQPPGWTYNPSSWLQRTPIIALGWVGFFFARLMAAYQFGYIDSLWDPFFGSGTEEILDSDISRAWPISDAGLGVFAYAVEALMGYMGGTARWRTMPWMVTFFGILVIPLSSVSIFLIIMQPVSVGTWSTYALITAAAMLVMIPLTLDEVVAMGQFLLRKRREGASVWHVFWYGGTVEGGDDDERSPKYPAPLGASTAASVWGMTLPWTLLFSTVVGVWLMAAPSVLGTSGSPADSDHLVGALVVSIAVIAMAEIGRSVRFINVLFGVWLVASPLLIAGGSVISTVSDVVAGLALIALAIPRGSVRERYGTAMRWIK